MTRSLGFLSTLFVSAALLCGGPAAAFVVTSELEAFTVPSVGGSFTGVTFENTYTNPIAVCNGRTVSNANWMPVVRIDGLTGTGMNVRVQKFADVANDTTSPTVAVNEVHCVVTEAGLHQLPDGSWYQAGSVLSDQTNWRAGWSPALTEEVTGISANITGTRGVLTQIMTSNDARGQVAHVHNCVTRTQNPFAGGRFCVGRHTGGFNTARASETVGYIVFQQGNTTFVNADGITIRRSAGVTSDSVRSVNDSPPYTFSTSGQMEVGVTSQIGTDGVHGSYSGLYGADPLAGAQIRMALDETTNLDRNHTTEFVSWWAFGQTDTSFEVIKDVDITTTGAYDLLTYTITVENTGEAAFEEVTLSDVLTQGATALTLDSGPTLVAASDTNGNGELDVGETWEYTATYQLSDDDFDRVDDVVNSAEFTLAVVAGGTTLPPVSDTAVTSLLPNPLIEVVKSSTLNGGGPIPATGVSLGDEVLYTYDIENTGNVGLSPVVVNDAHFGAGSLVFQSCMIISDADADSILGGLPFQITRLGAGDLARCTALYTVIQADIDAQ